MSIEAIAGFEAVQTTKFADLFDVNLTTAGGPAILAGRYGGQAVQLSNSAFGFQYYGFSVANRSNLILSANIQSRYQTTVNPKVGQAFFHCLDGTTSQCSVGLDSTGHIQAYQGGSLGGGSTGATVLGTSSATFFMESGTTPWHNVQAQFIIDSVAGSIEVWVDGVQVLLVTGVNTQTTGNAFATNAGIHYADLTSDGRTFDDFYIFNSNGSKFNALVVTPLLVDAHLARANGTNISWTPLSAPNYSQINDYANKNSPGASPVPDDDTTYNLSGPVGSDAIDSFFVDSFSTAGAQNGVQLRIRARTDVAAGPREINPMIYKGGTAYQGATISLTSTAWKFFRDLTYSDTDPSTTNDWSGGALNGTEFGVTNVGGLGGLANSLVSQIVVERLGIQFDPFCANHPMILTG